jgi:hypothetical protein
MKKTIIEWRKATEEELQGGSAEMIKVSEIEVDVIEEQPQAVDVASILLSLSPEKLAEVKAILRD